MTTTSPIPTIKPRITGSTSIQTLGSVGYDLKSSRIYVKKHPNGNHFTQTVSNTNGFGHPYKKRATPLNHFFISRQDAKEDISPKDINRFESHALQSPLPAFLPASPISNEETNSLSVNGNSENEQSKSADDANHQKVEIKLAHVNGHFRQSSCSDADNHHNGSRVLLSNDDTDADESDNEQRQISTKSRRLQKTRKPNNNGLIQHKPDNHLHHPTPSVSRNVSRIDENRRSSSNEEEENKESISRLNDNHFPHRRGKLINTKKSHPTIVTQVTTTTTDDELIRQPQRLEPPKNFKSILETTNSQTNESNLSSPNAANSTAPFIRKINRFQVKSIKKSQQPHVLLANATVAKSSNEDDCSVPNERSENEGGPAIIERQSINTPTTDGENSQNHHFHNNANRADSRENGHHHVHFQISTNGKRPATIEEDKLSAPSTHTVTVTASIPPSSTTPAQAEMMKIIPGVSGWIPSKQGRSQSFFQDDEEEAVGISPDGRFIKYAKEIGRGAFKTVYRGLDTETSVAVAWCELQDFAQFDKHERARFKEEAEMLKKLQHQNIVRFYDFWEETNPRTNKKVIILVTELMTSGSLKSYIRKFKGQKEDKRINVMKKWCRQILKGLAYLHSRNPPVIHRDLKCDNVFISSTTGCVKIGDLGLATFKTQTFAKSMRGTMEFMAPEMFDEKYDELVDIYSFGLCMLEMITGEYPYIECKVPTAVIRRVTAGMKPDCYYKVENEDVREVIDCCIRTKREERLPVNELLQHSFFHDDIGLRIELVRDSTHDHDEQLQREFIEFKLKIIDKTKRKTLWTEHEAIRFRYNIKNDTPEQIADELIQKKYIFDEDRKFVIQSIKDRLRSYRYEQIDRKAGVFSRDGKPTLNQTSSTVQATNPIQMTATPLPTTQIVVPPVVPTLPTITPTPLIQQQQSTDITQNTATKSILDLPSTKPIVNPESVTIAPVSEINSNVTGSTRSLEVLDAALKKTFTKTNSIQNVHPTSMILSDSSEPITPLTNPEDTPVFRSASHSISIPDQQIIEEILDINNTDNIQQPCVTSNTVSIQNLCQPVLTTTTANHQTKASTNQLLSCQTAQNLTSSISPNNQSFLNTTTIPESAVKQTFSSSSSTTTDGTDSASTISSVPMSNEPLPPVILPDITSNPSTQIPGSLKQLDVLLTHTFKTPSKNATATHGSDTEGSANTTIPAIIVPSLPITISEDHPIKMIEIDSDEGKRKLTNGSSTSGSQAIHNQPSSSSIILPMTVQRNKSQTPPITNNASFDPFNSPERNQNQQETTLKTPHDKSSLNDDTIVAASTSDLSDIKSMIADLNKNLMQKMFAIEQKLDQQYQQTERLNSMLTETVLPSLIDLTDIINETSMHMDSRIRLKLETIRTSIRTIKQQPEIKDLMEI